MLNITGYDGDANSKQKKIIKSHPLEWLLKKRKIATTRCGEIGTTIGCRWECKMVQLLWKTVWQVLNRLTVKFPYDQDLYSWVCIYTRDWNMSTQKLVNKCSQCHFHNSHKEEKPWCSSTDKWVNNNSHTVWNIIWYKKWNTNSCYGMSEAWAVMLSERCRSQRPRWFYLYKMK